MKTVQMKLRLGFVTNSSSTNYIIVWKGDKQGLIDWIKSPEFINEIPERYDTFAKARITREMLIEDFIKNILRAEVKTRKDMLDKIKEKADDLIKHINSVNEMTDDWYNAQTIFEDLSDEMFEFENILRQAGNDWEYCCEIDYCDECGHPIDIAMNILAGYFDLSKSNEDAYYSIIPENRH